MWNKTTNINIDFYPACLLTAATPPLHFHLPRYLSHLAFGLEAYCTKVSGLASIGVALAILAASQS